MQQIEGGGLALLHTSLEDTVHTHTHKHTVADRVREVVDEIAVCLKAKAKGLQWKVPIVTPASRHGRRVKVFEVQFARGK